jgi:transposase-like protein
MPPYSLTDLLKQFPDQQACLRYLFEQKYTDPTCPKCHKSGRYHQNKKTGYYTCSCGGSVIHPRAGTLFEKSKINLQTWFICLFLMARGTHSLSEIQKISGISYPNVWSMQRRVMELIARHITDKEHLFQWEGKMRATYHHTYAENKNLYLSLFQFKHEQEKEKKDPFFTLLNLAIHHAK